MAMAESTNLGKSGKNTGGRTLTFYRMFLLLKGTPLFSENAGQCAIFLNSKHFYSMRWTGSAGMYGT